MTTARTRAEKTQGGQMVRLPEEVAFPTDVELTAVRSGDVVMLYPSRQVSGAELADQLTKLPVPASFVGRLPVDIPDRG